MATVLQPWQIRITAMAGWISRHQVEVWTPRGLATLYVFFVFELETRCIDIAGITSSPNEPWMMQVGRSLIDQLDE